MFGSLCAAQIQQLKHSVSKGDKKKKRDVAAQIAVLETELEAKHQQELQAFVEQIEPTFVSCDCFSLQDIQIYLQVRQLSDLGAFPHSADGGC